MALVVFHHKAKLILVDIAISVGVIISSGKCLKQNFFWAIRIVEK